MIHIFSWGMVAILALILISQIVWPAFTGGRFFWFFRDDQTRIRELTHEIDQAHGENIAKDMEKGLKKLKEYDPNEEGEAPEKKE